MFYIGTLSTISLSHMLNMSEQNCNIEPLEVSPGETGDDTGELKDKVCVLVMNLIYIIQHQ